MHDWFFPNDYLPYNGKGVEMKLVFFLFSFTISILPTDTQQ